MNVHLAVNPSLVLVFDLAGTFVFALSGAMVGVTKKMDVFGVLVLAFVAGNAGGITRDVLIGDVPPAGLNDWRYVAAAVLAGLITFQWHPILSRLRTATAIFDAAGLALFAVAGAQKALDFGLEPGSAILLGMLTGIGGGVARDVLAAEIPTVLRTELYAVAALAGASVVVAGDRLDLPSAAMTLAGAALCFGLRFLAISRGWQLPSARPRPEESHTHAHSHPDDADNV